MVKKSGNRLSVKKSHNKEEFAVYTVVHSCGHSIEYRRIKTPKMDDVAEKMSYFDCASCQAKSNGAGLIGSDKQVAWSARIRQSFRTFADAAKKCLNEGDLSLSTAIESLSRPNEVRAMIGMVDFFMNKIDDSGCDGGIIAELKKTILQKLDEYENKTAATWWIDHRDNYIESFVCSVRSTVLMKMKLNSINRSLSTEKSTNLI